MFCGTPLLWVSNLQTEVALSTVEAEYIALSQSMRDLLPTQQLLQELQQIFQTPKSKSPTATSTIFEDNAGALQLARCPKMRPRTKHIAVKYHHFRDHVKKRQHQHSINLHQRSNCRYLHETSSRGKISTPT